MAFCQKILSLPEQEVPNHLLKTFPCTMARASGGPIGPQLAGAGQRPAHAVWLCWGAQHFAAVTAAWLDRAHRAGCPVGVAASEPALEVVEGVLARYPGLADSCARVRLRWGSAEGPYGEAWHPGGFWVVRVPLDEIPCTTADQARAALEKLEQLEARLEQRARSSAATVVCAYDVSILQTWPDELARTAVGMACRAHSMGVVAGTFTATPQAGPEGWRAPGHGSPCGRGGS